MVQGLAFLSKKSWHTKNLANQEKVWMAEQQKAAEESKTKELAKQIQQEREEEELDKIAGRKNVRRDRGIDWMYQGGTGAAKQEEEARKNEEYLMGKEFQPEGRAGGDFADLEQGGVNDVVAVNKPAASEEQAVAAVAAAAPASAVNAEPSVADRNEAFRMRHEDPMFLVSQTQRDKQNQHDKKRALYERVVGPTEDKKPEGDDERRRSKKERKRERKHRRREEEGRRSDRHHRKRHRRTRSRSRDRDDRDHRRRHERRHRSRSPSEDRSRSRSPERHYRDDDRGYESRRRARSRSRSYERDERRRYRSRSPSPRDDYRRRGSSSGGYDGRERYERPAYINRKPSPPRYREEERSSRPEGYGLQGGKTLSSKHDDDLGPNRQLLDRKREERDSERRRIRESASTRRRMTEVERAAALQAMERDASKRDELLNRAVAAKSRQYDDEQEAAPSSGKASFLQDMAERTHGIRDGASLKTRVAQKRHTNQKAADDFM